MKILTHRITTALAAGPGSKHPTPSLSPPPPSPPFPPVCPRFSPKLAFLHPSDDPRGPQPHQAVTFPTPSPSPSPSPSVRPCRRPPAPSGRKGPTRPSHPSPSQPLSPGTFFLGRHPDRLPYLTFRFPATRRAVRRRAVRAFDVSTSLDGEGGGEIDGERPRMQCVDGYLRSGGLRDAGSGRCAAYGMPGPGMMCGRCQCGGRVRWAFLRLLGSGAACALIFALI